MNEHNCSHRLKFNTMIDRLLQITLLSCFGCCIPLLMDWEYAECKGDDGSLNQRNSLSTINNSTAFMCILVASIAISIPMVLEAVLNIAMSNERFTSNRLPYIFLVISLCIPDLLVLVKALPEQNFTMVICLFNMRFVLLTYAIWGHLWHSGLPIFRTKSVFVAVLLIELALVFSNLGSFTCDLEFNVLSSLGYVCSAISFTLVINILIRWILKLHHAKFSNLTTSDYCYTYYLIAYIFVAISLVILTSLLYSKSVIYLFLNTLVEIIFTVTISVLQRSVDQVNIRKSNKVSLCQFVISDT